MIVHRQPPLHHRKKSDIRRRSQCSTSTAALRRLPHGAIVPVTAQSWRPSSTHLFMLSTRASEAARRTLSASALPSGATACVTAASTNDKYPKACARFASYGVKGEEQLSYVPLVSRPRKEAAFVTTTVPMLRCRNISSRACLCSNRDASACMVRSRYLT